MIKAAVNLNWNLPYIASQVDPTITPSEFYCDGVNLVITKNGLTQQQLDTAIANYTQAAANTYQENKYADESVSRLDDDPVLRAIIEVLITEINSRKRALTPDLTITNFAQSLKSKIKEIVRPRFPQLSPRSN